jgi:hypothetical protein
MILPSIQNKIENDENWATIEKEEYGIEIWPSSMVYTYQEDIERQKVEEIKQLYRSREIFLAPPTVKWSDDETKLIVIDGNHRAVAMHELVTQEGYVATFFGLYHKNELGDDLCDYPNANNGMLLAVVTKPHCKHDHPIRLISTVPNRMD